MTKPGQPYLDSQSIYSFDLDEKTLTISDYDLFSPARDLVLHMGFTVKRISPNITELKRCEVRSTASSSSTLEDAYKHSEKLSPEEARVEIIDGAVNFKIPGRLTIAASKALLLVLQYTIKLDGEGSKLLFSGAIQPSDYRNIQNSLRVRDVKKEIILQVHSASLFSVRIFNASKPVPFTESIHAAKRRDSSPDFMIRESLTLDMQDWERALYFSICQD